MENISLFDQSFNRTGSFEQRPVLPKLDVVRLKFEGVDALNWQELFSGYDTLHFNRRRLYLVAMK